MIKVQFILVLRAILLANIFLLIVGLLIDSLTSEDNIVTSSTNDVIISVDSILPAHGEKQKEFGISDKNEELFKVPNYVHFIWYTENPKPLKFYHMLSILAAHKFIKPDLIYFHTNLPPVGKYWDHVKLLDKLKLTFRQPPTQLFGENLKNPMFYTSHSNVDRVKILMEYGGIYLDLDMVAVRSFDELRRRSCTIGREQKTKACGSVVVCCKDSPFLLLWMNSYFDDYKIEEWAYNSGQVPFNLALRYPHLVHMEETRLNRPNFMELDQIWGETGFNWTQNYAVHLWYRLWKDRSALYRGVEPNETNVGRWIGVFGEMARRILFGDTKLTDAIYRL